MSDDSNARAIAAAEAARREADERDAIMAELDALLARAERVGCVRLVSEAAERRLRDVLKASR